MGIFGWTMLATNLVVVLAVYYSGKNLTRYGDGMLLGVHIPPQAPQTPEVAALCRRMDRAWRAGHLVNLVLGVAMCGLGACNAALFVLVWMAWLVGYLAWVEGMLLAAHRKMYRLKCANGWWQTGARRVVLVDTVVAAAKLAAPGWVWHLPLLALELALGGWLALASQRLAFGAGGIALAWFGCTVAGTLAWTLLHAMILRRPAAVYSQDSRLNLAAEQQSKNVWSAGMLAADGGNAVAWTLLAVHLHAGALPGGGTLAAALLPNFLGVVVLLALVLPQRQRRAALLAQDEKPTFVDDDEYWKNGWYNNPHDNHLFVQGRMSAGSYGVNMARPAGRRLALATAVLVVGALLWVIVAMLPLVHVQVSFAPGAAGGGAFSGGGYTCAFSAEEVETVELLETMPQEGFVRTNGASTAQYSMGHYSGSRSGACMLFVLEGQSPILKIKLEGKTLYVTAPTPQQTQSWYTALQPMAG